MTDNNNDDQLEALAALDALEDIAQGILSHGNSDGDGVENAGITLESWGIWKRQPTDSIEEMVIPRRLNQLFYDAHRLDGILKALHALKSSVSSLQQRYTRHLEPISSKLSKGILSIPDEILALIFEFAAFDEESVKEAIWLSHVSRRFRLVALRTSSLWNTLDGYASDGKLEALIARSGSICDLHVILHGSMSSNEVEDFLDITLPVASRWSSLAVVSLDNDDVEWTLDAILIDMSDSYDEDNLVFPRLRDLQLRQYRSVTENGTYTWTMYNRFNPRWSIPNIRTIRCEEYVPAPSPTYATLESFTTSFSLITNQYPSQLQDLISFLDSVPAVTSIDIAMRPRFSSFLPLQLTKSVCPSVTSLTVEFSSWTTLDSVTYVIEPFLESLSLPHLTSYSVSLEFQYEHLFGEWGGILGFPSLGGKLLPGLGSRSNLKSFNFKISLTEGGGDLRRDATKKMSIFFPLHTVPRVSTLVIRSFTDVLFLGGHESSALRKLHLVEFENLDIEVLEGMVKDLKRKRVWGDLESFVLDRCRPALKFDDVVKVVGANKLVFIE